MKVMLMAAGRGERLRPLTDTTPKPLVSAGGQPLIEYHLEQLAAAGVRDVVINLAWLGSQIRERLGDGARWGLRIVYSDEGERGLETGGGIHRALPLLGNAPFVVINADIYSEYSVAGLRSVIDEWADRLAHLVCIPNPPHNASGDFSVDGGRLTNDAPFDVTFSGISVLSPELFSDSAPGSFPLAPLLRAQADAGRVTAEVFDGAWFDAGTVERLGELDQYLREPSQQQGNDGGCEHG